MSLDAIGIVSKNIQASIKFYEILGISLKQEGGPDHYEGSTSRGVRIMVDSVELMRKLNPDWEEPVGSGVILCFKQESAAEVNDIFKKVISVGYSAVKEPWDAFWGQRYASVLDPDGNQIDIFATL